MICPWQIPVPDDNVLGFYPAVPAMLQENNYLVTFLSSGVKIVTVVGRLAPFNKCAPVSRDIFKGCIPAKVLANHFMDGYEYKLVVESPHV